MGSSSALRISSSAWSESSISEPDRFCRIGRRVRRLGAGFVLRVKVFRPGVLLQVRLRHGITSRDYGRTGGTGLDL
jgi:hypothetical protein